MVAHGLDPIFPGQGQELNDNYIIFRAPEEEDVLPSEGADDTSVEQPPTVLMESDPSGSENGAHGPQTRSSGRNQQRPAWWNNYYVANESVVTIDSGDLLQDALNHGTIDPITFTVSNDPDVM
jgi:hypothetical protein